MGQVYCMFSIKNTIDDWNSVGNENIESNNNFYMNGFLNLLMANSLP